MMNALWPHGIRSRPGDNQARSKTSEKTTITKSTGATKRGFSTDRSVIRTGGRREAEALRGFAGGFAKGEIKSGPGALVGKISFRSPRRGAPEVTGKFRFRGRPEAGFAGRLRIRLAPGRGLLHRASARGGENKGARAPSISGKRRTATPQIRRGFHRMRGVRSGFSQNDPPLRRAKTPTLVIPGCGQLGGPGPRKFSTNNGLLVYHFGAPDYDHWNEIYKNAKYSRGSNANRRTVGQGSRA